MPIGDYTETVYNNGGAPAINDTNLNNNEGKTKELDDTIANSFNMSPETYIINVGQQDDPINSEYTIVLGTQSADTTNKKVGNEALRITENDNVAGFLSSKKTVSYDYSVLNNGSDFANDDYFNFIVNISDVSLTQDLIFIFRTDASNFYTITINSGLVTGSKTYSVLKSLAVATLSPDWADVTEIEIGWTSVINAINEFVVFNTFLPVIKDASSSKPNPFQRLGVVEGTPDNDYFVGFEFGRAKIKYLGTVDNVTSLKFASSYVNFVASVTTKSSVSSIRIRGLVWHVDTNNYIMVYFLNDEMRLLIILFGNSTIHAVPFPINANDVVNFTLTKNTNGIEAVATINWKESKNITVDNDYATTIFGNLAIPSESTRVADILSASITEISHAHHSDVAEAAKILTGEQSTIIEENQSNIADLTPVSGTWTPTLEGNSGGVATMDAATYGSFIKTGNLVYAQIYIQLTNKGTIGAGETIRIEGLPFDIQGDFAVEKPCLVIGSTSFIAMPSTARTLAGTGPRGNSRIDLVFITTAGVTSVLGVDIGATTIIIATLIYKAE